MREEIVDGRRIINIVPASPEDSRIRESVHLCACMVGGGSVARTHVSKAYCCHIRCGRLADLMLSTQRILP